MNVYEIHFKTVPMTEDEVRRLAAVMMKAADAAFVSAVIHIETTLPILETVAEVKP